jgi:RnfABCDGE-type electron transport complex B subunit
MSATILYTIISLSILGGISAIVLFFVAQRFKVFEDPRIEMVAAELPSANCGGCGLAGCRNLAETLVNAETFDDLFCPVGGNEVMAKIAAILGRDAVNKEARVTVLRCSGTCDNRVITNHYDGAASCKIASALYSGETGCSFGCAGLGDCVAACKFGGMHMDAKTGLPVVDESICTACGSCVKACPKNLFELRKKWKGNKKIYVSCNNEDKGPVARKSCTLACIGCGKCQKVCIHDAIVIKNYLAYIDSDKCKLCRKCVEVCPTHSIVEIGFPARKSVGAMSDVSTGPSDATLIN